MVAFLTFDKLIDKLIRQKYKPQLNRPHYSIVSSIHRISSICRPFISQNFLSPNLLTIIVFPRKRGKETRDMDHSVGLQQREYGRKLQDVNCLLGKVGEEQKRLSEHKVHVQNEGVVHNNEQRVQVRINVQTPIFNFAILNIQIWAISKNPDQLAEVSAEVSAGVSRKFLRKFLRVSRKFLRFARRNFRGSLAEICTKFRINFFET